MYCNSSHLQCGFHIGTCEFHATLVWLATQLRYSKSLDRKLYNYFFSLCALFSFCTYLVRTVCSCHSFGYCCNAVALLTLHPMIFIYRTLAREILACLQDIGRPADEYCFINQRSPHAPLHHAGGGFVQYLMAANLL